METAYLIPEKLNEMLKNINVHEGFRKFLKKVVEKMNVEKNNILNLSPEKVANLYIALKNKIQTTNYVNEAAKIFQNSIWLENQLRTFIYIFCCYLFFQKIAISDLKQEDFLQLHELFPNKLPEHLEYQIKLLLNDKNIKWNIQESRLFQSIMRQNMDSKRWNYIAKQLFTRSKKKYFKTPKQCRQRFINHVDITKIKGNWTKAQDLVLLQSVLKHNKKWTVISHQLNDTRTENSVKNRFNSLIKYGKKQYGFHLNEDSIVGLLFQNLNKQLQRSQLMIEKIAEEKLNQIQRQQKQQKQDKTQVFKKQSKQNSITKGIYKDIQLKEENILLAEKDHFVTTTYDQQINFKFIFDQSEHVQNIAWNGSQSIYGVNIDLYLCQRSFCFDDQR